MDYIVSRDRSSCLFFSSSRRLQGCCPKHDRALVISSSVSSRKHCFWLIAGTVMVFAAPLLDVCFHVWVLFVVLLIFLAGVRSRLRCQRLCSSATRLKIALFSRGDDPPLPQRPMSWQRVRCETRSGGIQPVCLTRLKHDGEKRLSALCHGCRKRPADRHQGDLHFPESIDHQNQ